MPFYILVRVGKGAIMKIRGEGGRDRVDRETRRDDDYENIRK